MKYFYIHGLNSTGINTAAKLSKLLETDVEILNWDFTKQFNYNIKLLKNTLDKEEDSFILMGSSMGGFYANYLANDYNVPCALFNPVINPMESFENLKNIEFYQNLPVDEIKDSYNIQIKNKILQRVIVVGLNDTVVDPQKTIELWNGKCLLITTNDEHQIEDFSKFKDDLLDLQGIDIEKAKPETKKALEELIKRVDDDPKFVNSILNLVDDEEYMRLFIESLNKADKVTRDDLCLAAVEISKLINEVPDINKLDKETIAKTQKAAEEADEIRKRLGLR